ncbi:MAG: hypothetical protein H7Y22_02605 [Gemmatimonadaceae bacterium]|nr:hypothetical protein [Gloeobacterales cyanobacterium ES-bin-141]
MTRGKPMTGNCKGCEAEELQARQLCNRCYDFAHTQAHRQGLDLDTYLANTANLASPGRHHNRPQRHNRSGHRGCSFDRGKWRAYIKHQGKTVHLGRFDTVEQAKAVYEDAQNRLKKGLTLLHCSTSLTPYRGQGREVDF